MAPSCHLCDPVVPCSCLSVLPWCCSPTFPSAAFPVETLSEKDADHRGHGQSWELPSKVISSESPLYNMFINNVYRPVGFCFKTKKSPESLNKTDVVGRWAVLILCSLV